MDKSEYFEKIQRGDLIMEHYGVLSLISPLVAIIIAILSKNVIISLFAGSFLGVQSRNQMDREEDRIAQAEFGDVVQLTGQVMDVREKTKNWK